MILHESMVFPFIKDGVFIEKKLWKEHIRTLQREVGTTLYRDKEICIQLLKKTFMQIMEEITPKKPFGIMFSGGVDSALIALACKKLKRNFYCYTVGFQEDGTKEPEDVTFAKRIAKQHNLPLKIKLYNKRELLLLLKETMQILGEDNDPDANIVVNAGVGAVLLGCTKLANKDNIASLFSGIGSEEIFAGYFRHVKAEDKQQECWNGLYQLFERDLMRDGKIALATNITFITPFLEDDLIDVAMKIPASFKIKGKKKKLIMRDVAQALGLDTKAAQRRKQAAQYGSRIDATITKFARNHPSKKAFLTSLLL